MPTDIVRTASAFIWVVVEGAGSRSLRDAAVALYPDDAATGELDDRLRHVLFFAAALLCDSASLRRPSDSPPSPAAHRLTAAHVARLAQRFITAVRRATRRDLAVAHAYLLAPSWRCALAQERPLLASLSLEVARLMIGCAMEWPGGAAPVTRGDDTAVGQPRFQGRLGRIIADHRRRLRS